MADAPTENEPTIVEDDIDISRAPCTDVANAHRFYRYTGNGLKYQWFGERGRWLRWDGKKWDAETGEETAHKAAHAVALSIYSEIENHESKEMRKKMAAWAEKSLSRQRLDAMLAEARPYMGARAPEFDRDPILLNVQNGVLDLQTGKLLPHDPALMMTRISRAAFDPSAKAPKFEAFLEKVLPDPEVRRHLQLWAGYTLTGVVSERKFRIDIGDRARNGKSTLYNIMLALLGDYGGVTLFDTFGTRRDDQETPKNGLAALAGKRLVVAIESAQNFKMNVNLVKSITGSDPITCRFLFKEFFTYLPQFKVWLASNNPPRIADDNNAIWDRMQRTDWNVRIAEDEEIKGLSDIIIGEELSGVLNWALKGCLEWQGIGALPMPTEVARATREYREEEFILSEFIDEMCERVDGSHTKHDELYIRYKVWYMASGQESGKQLTKYRFGQVLAQRFPRAKIQGVSEFKGVRIRRV